MKLEYNEEIARADAERELTAGDLDCTVIPPGHPDHAKAQAWDRVVSTLMRVDPDAFNTGPYPIDCVLSWIERHALNGDGNASNR